MRIRFAAVIAGALGLVAGPATSEQAKQTSLKDALVVHANGFISVEYDGFIDGSAGEALFFTLRRDIIKAGGECVTSQIDVHNKRVYYLPEKVKQTLDSLKHRDGSYSDYLIMSGLMRKYAGRTTTSSTPHFDTDSPALDKDRKASHADLRSEGYFRGRCPAMFKAMMPGNRMNTSNVDIYSADLCRQIAAVKGCYADLEKAYALSAEGRRNDIRGLALDGFKLQEGVSGTID